MRVIYLDDHRNLYTAGNRPFQLNVWTPGESSKFELYEITAMVQQSAGLYHNGALYVENVQTGRRAVSGC